MNKSRIKIQISLYLLLVFSPNAIAVEQTKASQIPFIENTIVLDGNLDEESWKSAKHFSLNYTIEPYENTEAPVTTEVYVFESGDTLYVGFIAVDPAPENIRAYLRDRDKVWDDDLVGFRLDTYGTQKLAYHFYVNPKGVQIDSIQSELNGSMRDDWDANWQAVATITPEGYNVEMAIPLDKLHFSEKQSEKNWAVEFIRWYPRDVKFQLSHIPIDRNNGCSLCRLSPITGFKNIQQSEDFTITPSVVATRNEKRNVYQNQPWKSSNDFEFGADINWHISSDDLFSATINPDFSQIEVDSAQLSLNSNFSLYFPEKRRFFLENQSYFDSMYQLVHTRNLIDPDLGVKFTSRKNNHTIATLIANDQTTNLLIPGNLSSTATRIEQESINGAFRYRYDFGNDSSIGVTSTVREANSYHNYVIAIDNKLRFTDSTSMRWHLLKSDTEYPDDLSKKLCNFCSSESSLRANSNDELTDYALQVELNHSARNWWFYANHIQNGADFRADLGFQDTADYKYYKVQSGYVSYEPISIWNRIEIWTGYSKETNLNNELIGDNLEVQLNFNGIMQTQISTGFGKQRQVGLRYDNSTTKIEDNAPLFDLNFAFVYAQTRPYSSLLISTLIRKADTVDYANNRLAKQFYWQPIIQWDVNQHFNLNATYTYENLDSANQDLYIARLTDVRANYQFTSASKLRMSIIHNNLSFNPNNYINKMDHNFKSLGVQFVYSYRFSALSAFYLGYSSNAVETDRLGKLVQQEKNIFTKLTLSY